MLFRYNILWTIKHIYIGHKAHILRYYIVISKHDRPLYLTWHPVELKSLYRTYMYVYKSFMNLFHQQILANVVGSELIFKGWLVRLLLRASFWCVNFACFVFIAFILTQYKSNKHSESVANVIQVPYYPSKSLRGITATNTAKRGKKLGRCIITISE